MMARVLIACEYSGRVRDAFARAGHDAMSCDLLPTEAPGAHYQGDVFDIIGDGWDLLVAFPTCTFLTAAAEWTYRDDVAHRVKPDTLTGAARRAAREDAIKFVLRLWAAPIARKAIENPVGVLSTRWRKPTQVIQPYWFGEDASKATCLWLDNLPPLVATKPFEPRWICCGLPLPPGVGKYGCPNCNGDNTPRPRWGNQTDSGQNRLSPGPNRWKERSRTFQGVADAMGKQWGAALSRKIEPQYTRQPDFFDSEKNA